MLERTRSPMRKLGAQSCVTTRLVPSSMRTVTRYDLSDELVVPAMPLAPVLPVSVPPALAELPPAPPIDELALPA
jgi:hypothetical protein